jgi:hypothetical protein
MKQQTMDRGTDALKERLGSDCTMLDIRSTPERTEFKFFQDPEQPIAVARKHGISSVYCCSIHPFTMMVTEIDTKTELLTVDRPWACEASACKCCCYQSLTVSSG